MRELRETYPHLPLYFLQNRGQLAEEVKFYELANGHATLFTESAVCLSFSGAAERSATLRLVPMGADSIPEIAAEGLQEYTVSYFNGNDPKSWKTNIPSYQSIVYRGIYDKVDMRFYGNNRRLEYDIVVHPGGDPSRVQILCDGAEGLRVTEEGDLEIILDEGSLIQRKPYLYQEIEGKRRAVEGRFVLAPQPLSYGFHVASYDKNLPLIIDPVLDYSTYLGGSAFDGAFGIAVDGSGNAYVSGYTYSANFPTEIPIQGSNGGSSDAFVTKIDPSGTGLLYSTYLGGSGYEWGYGGGLT